MKKSQAWSLDIMVAIVIFIGTIFVFYSIFTNNPGSEAKKLEKDASIVLENIASEDPDLGIVDGIEVDVVKLQELLGEQYSEIKDKIRTDSDFCIFLEDEKGDVIYISGEPGIGSGNVKISGEGCNPDCNDGIDNDADGNCDLAGSTCTDGSNPGDTQCSSTLDDDESS
tara:strand:+ start:961 stop:1467 length:507 start_codon:yes stop_codon:yes gene_type:complete